MDGHVNPQKLQLRCFFLWGQYWCRQCCWWRWRRQRQLRLNYSYDHKEWYEHFNICLLLYRQAIHAMAVVVILIAVAVALVTSHCCSSHCSSGV